MFSIGGLVEKVCDAVGLPEWVGDAAEIGAGFVMHDPVAILDGAADLTPNVCDFLEDKLDLGPPKPGEDRPAWKDLARMYIESQRASAQLYEGAKGALMPLAGDALKV